HCAQARGVVRGGRGVTRHWRLLLPLALLGVAVVLVVWRGPDWGLVHDAFSAVTWEWVAAAIGLNLLSVLTRAFAWDPAILPSIAIFVVVGVTLFLTAVSLAHRQHRELEELGRIRALLVRARQGLAIMRSPVAAATAASFQFAGWLCQLFAVWAAMEAFDIHLPISAAGLV